MVSGWRLQMDLSPVLAVATGVAVGEGTGVSPGIVLGSLFEFLSKSSACSLSFSSSRVTKKCATVFQQKKGVREILEGLWAIYPVPAPDPPNSSPIL